MGWEGNGGEGGRRCQSAYTWTDRAVPSTQGRKETKQPCIVPGARARRTSLALERRSESAPWVSRQHTSLARYCKRFLQAKAHCRLVDVMSSLLSCKHLSTPVSPLVVSGLTAFATLVQCRERSTDRRHVPLLLLLSIATIDSIFRQCIRYISAHPKSSSGPSPARASSSRRRAPSPPCPSSWRRRQRSSQAPPRWCQRAGGWGR